jgi:hypothetical protein
MSKEAMKQALEALKDNQHLVADNERHAYVMEYNAIIEKLEEALANHCEDNLNMVKQEQSVSVGEPVAWIDNSGHPKHMSHVQSVSERKLYGARRPLYEAPQQRKPLTFEQADDVALDVMGFSMLDKEQAETAHLLIRATEAAHGIKGE